MRFLHSVPLLLFLSLGAVAQGGGGCGNCVFPFIDGDRIHDRCTTIYGFWPWCSTKVDSNGVHIFGNWEVCSDPSCPGLTANPAEAITPHPLNVANPGVCYCGLPNRGPSTSRIVGGHKTDNGEYPWQVALLFYGLELMRQGCGGTLVGSKYVITAAHCTDDGLRPEDLMIRVGDTTLDTEFEAESFTYSVARIKNHQFNKNTGQNDIAVIELASSVPLDKYPHIKPACLPDAGATFTGKAVVTGWGSVNAHRNSTLMSSWLNEVEIDVFADGDCGLYNDRVTEDQLCAGVKEGGKNSCGGDSGGPLVASDPRRNGAMSLIGVVSYGSSICGEPDYPTVFAKVSQYTTWLNQQMPDLKTCPKPPSSPSKTTESSSTPSTTTPAPTTTMEPVPECYTNNIPTRLKGHKRIKRIWSWMKCRDLCNDDPDCDYFKWKRSQCRLMSVVWEDRNSWVSGAKYCK